MAVKDSSMNPKKIGEKLSGIIVTEVNSAACEAVMWNSFISVGSIGCGEYRTEKAKTVT